MQFHDQADRWTLAGATRVADLYTNATAATTNPAVTLHSVGTAGGQAAAFTYDLARSVVQTRQGNPAWAGQKRDGQIDPIRSDDLFFPNWVDLNKVAIPQADEQQRLLANLVTQMSADRVPLPRFWYFPRGERAVVVMTGDDHTASGTVAHFDRFLELSPPGCSVADWDCVRSTSYVYAINDMTAAQVAAYQAQGFEIALHLNTGCGELHRGFAARILGRASFPSSSTGGRASSRRRGPTAPTASPGATGRASRRSGTSSGSGWTRTTTTGPAAGSRTDRGCSRAPASPCGSPTSTAR